MTTPKIIFFGTPDFAVPTLEAILKSGREVPLVITQPDRPAGRGLKPSMSAVKRFALETKIPVLQPKKMKDPEFHLKLKNSGAPQFVVVAYGRILPTEILTIPQMILNVHASLLPHWRGAAPIQRAILAGDEVTGVSIMKLVEEMDAGDVLLARETPIGPDESAGEVEERLSRIGAQALIQALDQIEKKEAHFTPQDPSRITFAPPVENDEGKIRWDRPAREVHNQIRGLRPRPGAFTQDTGRRVKILRSRLMNERDAAASPGLLRIDRDRLFVGCRDGWIEILELQREGKAKQSAAEFLRGYRIRPDLRWN